MKLLHKLPVPFLRIWNHHSDSEKNSLPGYISLSSAVLPGLPAVSGK